MMSFGIVDSSNKPSYKYLGRFNKWEFTGNTKIQNININNMAFAKMNCKVENNDIGD